MQILGIDVGSSSVKAALLREGKTVGPIVRSPFKTDFSGPRVEVPAKRILKAVADAIRQLERRALKADALALSVMAPSWCAMDARGEALTPVITHQDRRSVDIALELERRIGAERHLSVVGCRPFPGGISSTTAAWYARHAPQVLKKADLVGHLNTLLHRQLTGERVTDPSNASFMGLYRTDTLGGWSDELCESAGVNPKLLPRVLPANAAAGHATAAGARRFGLRQGLPVTTGIMDGSASMLLAGAKSGQLVNTCGSTDVLALCANQFRPHEKLLTRALGVGGLWLSVSTIAASGSAVAWLKQTCFPEMDWPAFHRIIQKVAKSGDSPSVHFDPYLAGDRMSIEQRAAGFTGLTLSTTRDDLLAAVLDSLAVASADRLKLMRHVGLPIRRNVVVAGRGEGRLDEILRRDWPGRWTFKMETEATLRGLSRLEPAEVD